MGLRRFSMHPSQILPVKERLFELSFKDSGRFAGRVLRMSDPMKIRGVLQRELQLAPPALLQKVAKKRRGRAAPYRIPESRSVQVLVLPHLGAAGGHACLQ